MFEGKKFFTIIMPIYNTGKFLNSAIESLLNQKLNFKDNVELLLIDDGSIDYTELICKKFVKKYPANIKYIHKENGGEASTKNLGIKFSSGQWIGFLDPDDTYSIEALSEVKKSIMQNKGVDMFSIPMFTFEREKKAHRLNYKFNGNRIIDIKEEPESIQLSSASSFFKKDILKEVKFPEELRVGEDMVFINRIFSKIKQYGVLSNVIYHYRKRYDKSSIMDNINQSYERYIPYVKKAMLNEIPSLLENGKLPEYHQNVFLYDLSGKIKSKEIPEPLTDNNNYNTYLELIWRVLQYIDNDIIKNSKFLDSHRKYVLIDFKEHKKLRKVTDIFSKLTEETANNILVRDKKNNILKKLSNVTFNITNFNEVNQSIQIMGFFESFFNFENFQIYFENNKKEKIIPKLNVGVKDNCFFIGHIIKNIFKIRASLPAQFLDKKVYLIVKSKKTGVAKKIHLSFVGRKARILKGIPGSSIVLGNKTVYYNSRLKSLLITEDEEVKNYLKLLENVSLDKFRFTRYPWDLRDIRNLVPYFKKEYRGKVINVFMDRVLKADDNAEALIKYFNSRKDKDVLNYFVLSANSPDFKRLKKEGINIIPYGSFEHLKILLVADNLIVSQMAWAVVEPFYDQYKDKIKDLFNFNLVFLQHGVIMCDVSNILKKSKIGVDLFITSAYPEKEEVSKDSYEYSKKEIILTGLPRHDNLTKKKGKYIAIMPTWSREVVSNERRNDLRLAIPGFRNTYYYKKWNSLLNNEKFLFEAERLGYDVIFVPHPELRGSVDMFELSKVKLANFDMRYRDIINNSSCVITDRSSVFMDFGYAEKEVFYYGPYDNNNYEDGYFNFEDDGFGPVSYDEETLVSQVTAAMKNNFSLGENYTERRNRFFAYNDSNNSKRVYDRINELTRNSLNVVKKESKIRGFLKRIGKN